MDQRSSPRSAVSKGTSKKEIAGIVFLEAHRSRQRGLLIRHTEKVLRRHTYPVTFLSGKPREAVEASVTLQQHRNKWLVLQLLQTRAALSVGIHCAYVYLWPCFPWNSSCPVSSVATLENKHQHYVEFHRNHIGTKYSITYPQFLKNKHAGQSILLQTGLKLHKHGFENLPSTQRRLLDAADLFETLPYLKLNDTRSSIDHGLKADVENQTFECKWLLEHSAA